MNLDRISACNVSPLVGPEQSQAVPDNLQGQSNAELKRLQSISLGNRCGHNKNKFKKPTFYGLRKPNARRPHTIEEALKRIDSAEKRLRESPNRSRFYLFEDERFASLFYRAGKNGKRRYRRSEGVESIIFLTLRAIIFTANLHQMACGFFDHHNQFHYYNYGYLEQLSGQSDVRVKRAMSVLKEEGILTVTPIYKTLDDGLVITVETRIDISAKLFEMLGLTDEFLSDREDAHIRWQKRENELERKDKRQNLYKPRPLSSRKVDNRYPKGCQSIASGLTNNLRPNYSAAYNPACDKQVIALAGELINARLCANMRDAITLAATKLGKTPPS